jgi:hypothetical protein
MSGLFRFSGFWRKNVRAFSFFGLSLRPTPDYSSVGRSTFSKSTGEKNLLVTVNKECSSLQFYCINSTVTINHHYHHVSNGEVYVYTYMYV